MSKLVFSRVLNGQQIDIRLDEGVNTVTFEANGKLLAAAKVRQEEVVFYTAAEETDA